MIDPADFGALEERVAQLSKSVEQLSTTVDKLSDALSEARGGWKIIAILGTVVLTVSGGVSWFVSHVKFVP